AVLLGDFLCPQMLFHRHGIVGAALHRGVVRDNYTFPPGDAPDASDDAGRGDAILVHPPGCELRELQKGRAGVKKLTHSFPWKQLAAIQMPLARSLAAALLDLADLRAKVVQQGRHGLTIALESLATRVHHGG